MGREQNRMNGWIRILTSCFFAFLMGISFLPAAQAQSCEPEGCYTITFDTTGGDASDCDTLNYDVTVQQAFSGDTGSSCNDIETLILPIACDHVSLVSIDGEVLTSDERGCVGGNLSILPDLEQDDGTTTYQISVELKECMCTQVGIANLEEEASGGTGGPACNHPRPMTGSAVCLCGDDSAGGTEECDGTDIGICIGEETCNEACNCVPPDTGDVECGQEQVDIMFMVDRTGSVSDSDLQAEGQAIFDLLQFLIDNNVTNVHVAIGRFPGELDGSPTDATLLSGLSADYAALQDLVNDHFIDSNSPSYEGTTGNTNLQSANQLALTELSAGNSPNKVYLLFSDGDTNRPTLATADHDARVSANALKAAGVRNFMIAYDASGNDGDSTSNGGDGSGDTVNRRLMADMATFADDLPPRGYDGCGGNGCTGAEETAENTDGDDLYIAATGAGLQPIFDALIDVLTCPDIDHNPCTPEECNPDTNLCESGPDIDGCVPCDEDIDCNSNLCFPGQCNLDTGKCEADEPVVCNDDNACTADSCDPSDGECDFVDTSSSCPGSVNICLSSTCDPASGCGFEPNTNPCDDGDVCTDGDACAGGSCVPGGPKDCDDHNACTADACESNNRTGCTHTPVNIDDGIPCTVDECDPNTGQITHTPQNNLCTDGAFCNGEEICDPGLGCQPGTPPACDDGAFCNGPETCDETNDTCAAGTPSNCGDGIDCTIDLCNEGTDSCNHTVDHEFCDDGQFCNGVETCDPVNDCVAGMAPTCPADDNTCNTEVCDPAAEGGAGACVSDQNPDAECDFDADCGAASPQICDPVNCECCPDVNEDGECDECVRDEDCDDGDVCNGLEECVEGGCEPGTPPTCGDGEVNGDCGEECDDGDANSDTEPDACRTDCTQATCGDNVTDSGEQCDGTDNDACGGQSCNANCQCQEEPGCPDQDNDGVCDGDDSGIAGTQGFQLRGNTSAGAFGCGKSNDSVEVTPVSAAMTGPSLVTLGVIGIGILRRYASKRRK